MLEQTIESLLKRWRNHCWAAFNKKHPSEQMICRAIRKYGKEAFLVEQIDTAETLKELNIKEIEWISKLGTFGNGYNMTEGGGGVVGLRGERHGMWGKGYLVSGEKNQMYGKTGEQHPMFGKYHTEETRTKMCAGWSVDRRSKFQQWSKNRVVSNETRQKIGDAHRGKKQSSETISKRLNSGGKKWGSWATKTYRVTDSNGVCQDVVGLKEFCKNNNLNYVAMNQAALHNTIHQGWKVECLSDYIYIPHKKRKYFTEDERIAAHRENQKRYRQNKPKPEPKPRNEWWKTEKGKKHLTKFIAAGTLAIHPRKLTQEQAAEIRMRIESGETRKQLAQEYGVEKTTINNVYNRKYGY